MTWEGLALSFLTAFVTASVGLFYLNREFTKQVTAVNRTLTDERGRREATIRELNGTIEAERKARRLVEDELGCVRRDMQSAAKRELDHIGRMETLEAERDRQSEVITGLTTRLEVASREAAEVPGLKREVAELRAQLTTMQTEAQKMDAMLLEKQREIARLETEAASLRAERDILKDERDTARAREAALAGEVERLKAQLAVLALTPPVVAPASEPTTATAPAETAS